MDKRYKKMPRMRFMHLWHYYTKYAGTLGLHLGDNIYSSFGLVADLTEYLRIQR